MPESGAKAPSLLVDAMLGSLARRLRWLGYDAEYRNDLPDETMLAIAREEGRLLVTRDRALAGRRGAWTLLVASESLEQQVQEVVDRLGPAGAAPRCTVCNGVLESLTIAEARPLVPAYVARIQTEFARCQRCGRVYWPGTHWKGLHDWDAP